MCSCACLHAFKGLYCIFASVLLLFADHVAQDPGLGTEVGGPVVGIEAEDRDLVIEGGAFQVLIPSYSA